MRGIPVLTVSGDCIARVWEDSLLQLYKFGADLDTQYDVPGDPPSKDATMVLTVEEPLSEPMFHLDLPGGFEAVEEYVMEVCEGIKDHLVRDTSDPDDHRWEYTYHQRLWKYTVPPPSLAADMRSFNQIEEVCKKLADCPFTRRAQAVTWKVWEDNTCYDPACLQSMWCRILPEGDDWVLSMNVRMRSNDAYKAAQMNIYAFIRVQELIAKRVSELANRPVIMGRYNHIADSYHLYGKDIAEFEARFLNAVEKRTFEKRTVRYENVKDVMIAARSGILDKAAKMGRTKD